MARSYHGTGEQAIEWVLHHSDDSGLELDAFLRCWQQGDLDEWPDFYEWLDAQPAAHNERIEALNRELVEAAGELVSFIGAHVPVLAGNPLVDALRAGLATPTTEGATS